MIRFLLGALLVGLLPGWALFRTPLARRERRAALPADERLFWAIVLSVLLSSMVALGLALAERYQFERLLAINAAVVAVVTVAWRGRLRYHERTGPLDASAVVPLLVVALAWWLYVPASEYVMGGKDPGTYMNEGIQIAQRGGVVIHDETIQAVPSSFRDLFFPQHPTRTYYGVRFMGFFVLRPAEGTVVGQFPHLFPAWIAVAYGLDGLTGARNVVGWWAVLSALAVFFVARRLYGWPPAALATLLLLVNVIQLWFARYPNAEVPLQALLFAGMLAYARAAVDEDRFFAPVAALLFVLALFLKPVEGVLALATLSAASVLLWWRTGRAPVSGLVVPLILGCGAAAAYLVTTLAPYARYPIEFVNNLAPWHWAALLGGGAAGAAALVAGRRHQALVSRSIPALASSVIVILAVYACFLREAGGRTAEHDAMALRSFAWYLTPVGLAAAVAGYVLAARRRFWHDPLLHLLVAVFAIVFFYKIRIVPEHFWMTRRFLPVILPGSLLFVAAPLALPPALSRRSRLAARAVVFALVAIVGVSFVRASTPVARHVEYAGLIPKLEQIAARFADDDLVIVESRNASDMHVLALPLAYIYARHVLVLASPRPDRFAFGEFLAWARGRYREVYFVGGGGTDLLTRTLGVEPVASDRFQIPEYESPRNAYPSGVRQKEFDFGVYRFVDATAVGGDRRLDIGAMDDLHVVRFHAKERDRSGGLTYRWTRDVSYVSLVGLPADVREVILWANDGRRPAKAPPADLEVSLNDRPLGSARVGPGFAAYHFEIPPDLAADAARTDEPARLRLSVPVWTPRTVLGTPDDRDLGIMLDRVEVR